MRNTDWKFKAMPDDAEVIRAQQRLPIDSGLAVRVAPDGADSAASKVAVAHETGTRQAGIRNRGRCRMPA